MAVSSKDMMDMLKAGQATPEADMPTPPPSEQGATTAPMASPMSTPEPQSGDQEQARLNIMMALDMLQQALGIFTEDTEEGKTLATVVADLTRRFGERESETRQLVPAEIMNMIENLPQAGGSTPSQRQAAMAAPTLTQPPTPV
jgi:hypothetical protein